MSVRTAPADMVGDSAAIELDAPEILFLLSAFIAPLRLPVLRAFTAYDLITGLVWLLLLLGTRRIWWAPRSLRLAALLLLVSGLLGGFRATVPVQSLLQVVQYAFVFFVQIPVILTIARSRAMVHAALGLFLSGYLVVVVIAFTSQNVQLAGRVVPFFSGNPNELASPTILMVPFVLYFALDLWRRGFYLTVLVCGAAILTLMIWSLTASASRGSTAATMVSLIVFVLFRNGWERARTILLRLVMVALGLIVLGSAIYWTNVFPDTLRIRIERTIGPDASGQSVADERIALDRAGLKEFVSSPLVGTGFDNFQYVGQFYDDAATYHAPHNLWIQFLAQAGLLGMGAFGFIIVRWFVLMLRTQSRVRSKSDRQLLWAFLAAMAGLMVNSMLSPLILHRHYWLLYGLGIAVAVELAGSVNELRPARVPVVPRGR
jgi:O-antigen ligase